MNSNKFFRKTLISWYLQNRRNLPWRNTSDPYMIWLSEIILQQTRVDQGLPYYNRFIAKFPTVKHLAEADESQVLRLWQGLGYYSRARNLHACAQYIVDRYNGSFPNNYEKLLQLKGVGAYTAAAISSFAFGLAIPVVDGNVFRVLSRIFGIENDISFPKERKFFQSLSEELIDRDDPYNYNQGIMEFGALQCTPAKPNCEDCVFIAICHAYMNNMQDLLPVKSKKVKVRKRFFNYLVIECKGKLLMKKRNEGDIWAGLYDFYLFESSKLKDLDQLLSTNNEAWLHPDSIIIGEQSPSYTHILSHQRIFATFHKIYLKEDLIPESSEFGFYSKKNIMDLPKPILIVNYLNDHIF